jgi:hypothetical protein
MTRRGYSPDPAHHSAARAKTQILRPRQLPLSRSHAGRAPVVLFRMILCPIDPPPLPRLAQVGPRTRLVTHLDVSRADVARVVALVAAFFARRSLVGPSPANTASTAVSVSNTAAKL